MSSNNFVRSGDHVKLLTSHQWSAEGNPTNTRGIVDRRGDSLTISWWRGDHITTNSYSSNGNDLLLLPVTLYPAEVDTIERYQGYCRDMGIECRITPFSDNMITITPMHPEQLV